MRTLGSEALRHSADNGCGVLIVSNLRRLKRALRPVGVVFFTACFAAYLSHMFQEAYRSFDDPMMYRKGGETDVPITEKLQYMERSASDFVSSLQSIQQDLYGIKSAVKGGLNQEMMRQAEGIVKRELERYNADKTGLTDYALENLGGCILSTRDTVTYKGGTPSLTFFGVPVMTVVTEPRYIIQPKVNPGDCWAIEGDKGRVVIQLMTDIFVSAITIEHISQSISPTGEISSAPRDLTLYGLDHLDDENPHKFGTFTYNKDGPAIQTYAVANKSVRPYGMVEVTIDSNQGHPDFTCIYRIRIHGRPPDLGLKDTGFYFIDSFMSMFARYNATRFIDYL